MKEFGLIALVLLVVLTVGIFGKGMSVYNTHIDLKTQIEAKQQDNEANFDVMWKKINQVAQVSDKYKDGLKEILTAYTGGRSKKSDQLMMDWTKEAIPTFDASIYKQINNVIVSGRDDFYVNQKILIDLSRQHNKFIQTFPNNIFCMILHIEPIEIKIVTSSKTEEAFKTGQENDVKL